MAILVTGGAGFIGSHIVRALLEERYDVTVLDNLSSGNRKNLAKEATFIKGDISNRKIWVKLPAKIDYIFHLAAQIDVRKSVEDAHFDAQNNILGTINVLDYARKAGAKNVVFSSSGGAIYGDARTVPTPEDYPAVPQSPYALSKWCGERYIDLFSRLHRLPCVVLRYANVYGPGQDGSKESGVIAIFTKRAKHGEPLTIFGDGKQTRDFVYVKDVVAANLAAMKHEANGTFNVGTGKETTVNELVKSLEAITGKTISVKHEKERLGELKRSCLAIDHAKTTLGWNPKYDLAEGLKETFAALKK